MSLNEATTYVFMGDERTTLQERIHAALKNKGFTTGDLDTQQSFSYFRLIDPVQLPKELHKRYQTVLGDSEAPPFMSVVDPLECWFATPSLDWQRLTTSSWQDNPSLPSGFRVLTRSGAPVEPRGSALASIVTTVANARYLAFALAEAGVLEALGPAYVSFE